MSMSVVIGSVQWLLWQLEDLVYWAFLEHGTDFAGSLADF
jgi:hypothetical protein